MRKYINLPQLSILFVGLFLLSACAEAPKKEEKKEEKKEKVESAPASEQIIDEEVSFMLPSPIQIAAIFNRAGLEYKSGLTNNPTNVDKYNTKTSKYLNFGVYSADLAYAVLNNQQQAAIDQLNAVKKMSDAIGMPNVFGGGDLIKSFESNIGNQDTILRILTTIKRRTDEFLMENEEESKEAIFFSAAWVEGMYIGANSTSGNAKVEPRLIEQMTILENIIKALRVQQDPSLDLNFLIDGLTNVYQTYNDFENVRKFNQGEIELSAVKLSDSELSTLTNQITELRTQIVNG
tara:strand:+ start:38870 stop:39745 length:876 start_codon:yes stop_codon:yes gene_type:complete